MKKPSKEKLEDLGILASGLVHEIRNPLNAIKANLQLMQEDCSKETPADDGPHSRRIERLLKEVDRLDKILSDFLAFVRGNELKQKKANLSQLLEEVVSLITPQAETNNISVLSDIKENIYANADSEALKQALMNLAANGIQAVQESDNKYGTLMIKLNQVENFAVIEIIDTGKGIPQEAKEHIYDLFFTTRSNGTGIGLAVVSKIVSSHNGEIHCESEPGKGTAFKIKLPILEE